MKKLNNFTFGVTITLSILLCCKCFQYAAGEHTADNVIGGEVFTLALPVLKIKWKMWTVEQEKKNQKKRLNRLRQTTEEQARLINHLLAEKENTLSQPTAHASNVAENPTE